MQSMHQGSSGPRPLPRNAGSTKQVHVAASPAPTQETERASTSTDASPPRASSVREVVNERPALPVADTANLSQQRSEQSSDIAPAHVPDEKDEATAAAEQRQPCSPGSSVAPRKFGDSSTVFESAVVPEVAGQVAISSPPRESSGSTKEMQATAVAQLGVGVQASSVEPCSLQASSWLDPAAEEPEDEKEDDSYRDEYEHITGGGWWDDETENHGFEYDGEQEQEETSEKTEENKQKEEGGGGLESSDWEEANEHAPEETMEDAADEAKEGGIAPEGQSTYHMSHDFHSSQRLAEDCLSELAMPTGTVAQVLVETPPNEEAQHATAAVHQQRECSEATGGGEKHENTQAPLPTVVPTGPDIQLVTVSGIMGNVAEPLAGTVPRTAATTVVSTIEQTGMGIQATSGYQRRSSYMPGQAVRPARSAARASIQLALPPIFAEEGPASGCDASSIDATQTSQAGAGVEAEESGQPVEGWEEYHKLNPGRQHSTPNLVSIRSRAMERRRSLELFESGDSDDSSTSSSSSSSGDEAGANKPEERKDKFDEDPLKWQQSEEGKSRIAQLTKATVRVESPATKISRKYLKLFAPSNSVRSWLLFAFSVWISAVPLLIKGNTILPPRALTRCHRILLRYLSPDHNVSTPPLTVCILSAEVDPAVVSTFTPRSKPRRRLAGLPHSPSTKISLPTDNLYRTMRSSALVDTAKPFSYSIAPTGTHPSSVCLFVSPYLLYTRPTTPTKCWQPYTDE